MSGDEKGRTDEGSYLDPDRRCDDAEPHRAHIWEKRGVRFVCDGAPENAETP